MKVDEDACSRDSRSTARVSLRGTGARVRAEEERGKGEGEGELAETVSVEGGGRGGGSQLADVLAVATREE